jgi:hypothetical protein
MNIYVVQDIEKLRAITRDNSLGSHFVIYGLLYDIISMYMICGLIYDSCHYLDSQDSAVSIVTGYGLTTEGSEFESW